MLRLCRQLILSNFTCTVLYIISNPTNYVHTEQQRNCRMKRMNFFKSFYFFTFFSLNYQDDLLHLFLIISVIKVEYKDDIVTPLPYYYISISVIKIETILAGFITLQYTSTFLLQKLMHFYNNVVFTNKRSQAKVSTV